MTFYSVAIITTHYDHNSDHDFPSYAFVARCVDNHLTTLLARCVDNHLTTLLARCVDNHLTTLPTDCKSCESCESNL
jgi:hypothetical protein